LNTNFCCKDNSYSCIDVQIDNSFSNKIVLCKKHYVLHMEHDDSVKILGYILEQEAIEVIKSTKNHGASIHPLEKLPENLLSIQNIEESMTDFLENNDSNNISTKLEDTSFD